MEERDVTGESACPVCGYRNERPADRCLSCGAARASGAVSRRGGHWSVGKALALLGAPWSGRRPDNRGVRMGVLLGLLSVAPWPLMGYLTAEYFAHFSDDPASAPIMARYARPIATLWHVAIALWLAQLALSLILLALRPTRNIAEGLLRMVALSPVIGCLLALAVCVAAFALLVGLM